jgi:hypothetical protein
MPSCATQRTVPVDAAVPLASLVTQRIAIRRLIPSVLRSSFDPTPAAASQTKPLPTIAGLTESTGLSTATVPFALRTLEKLGMF